MITKPPTLQEARALVGKCLADFQQQANCTDEDLAKLLNQTPASICAYKQGIEDIYASDVVVLLDAYNYSLNGFFNPIN